MSVLDYMPLPLEWMRRALCATEADPDVFYPPKNARATEAIKVCLECPVRDECLVHAVVNYETFGVWGGTSERQRRWIRLNTPQSGAAA